MLMLVLALQKIVHQIVPMNENLERGLRAIFSSKCIESDFRAWWSRTYKEIYVYIEPKHEMHELLELMQKMVKCL
jgi:hypothetical protein